MRKTLLLTLALLLVASSAHAEDRLAFGLMNIACPGGSAGGGGGSCATSRDACTAATVSTLPIGSAAGYQYRSTQFVAGATTSVCKIVARMLKTGSPTADITAAIYTDSAGKPGTIVGTWSSPVASSSIGASEEDVTFTGITSASLVAATTYHVVFLLNTTDASNNVGIARSAGCTTNQIYRSGDGATWSSSSTTNSLKYTFYSE